MVNYDFHKLSPYDLEILVRDLLQAEWGITLENFKTGKDGGIDLRYATAHEKIIVQCKHYVRTGLQGLLRNLKSEAVKARSLQPNRYVFVTSIRLSPANKKEIIQIMGDDILASGDVIGLEGLNNLLSKHPRIEGNHFKLWLASRSVFDRVLHNAVVTQSEFKVCQIYKEARRYVQNDAYPRALSMLNENRSVILAGPPGVGKTTLANLLLYKHIEQGYKCILIQRDIKEGQDLFQKGERQIFYFDDFMGATFLGDRGALITGNNDRALLEFIAMVRAMPTARLILTTREHIYSQAMDKSERLRHSDMGNLRVCLYMSDYSFAQKARILYNHLYFSDLPYEYQDEMLRNRFYLKIIKHEKFNPRIIEWLSSFQRIRKTPVSQYCSFIDGLLDDPSEIWRHAYEQETTNAGQSMLLTLFSLGGKSDSTALEAGFAAMHSERGRKYGFSTRPEDFRSALLEVTGAFIKDWGAHGFEVVDPSVLDLMNAVVREVPDNAVDIVVGAAFFNQIERLWTFSKANKGAPVASKFARHADQLINTIVQRIPYGRNTDLSEGVVRYHDATFERQLAVVIDIVDRMPDGQYSYLIEQLFDCLLKKWQSESPQIIDVIDVLRALDQTCSMNAEETAKWKEIVYSTLLVGVQDVCRSYELYEIISLLDIAGKVGDPMMAVIQNAFEKYKKSHFEDDLAECLSSDQFESLIGDLLFFRDEINVDIDSLIGYVEHAKLEFMEGEHYYEDYIQNEYKEQWLDKMAEERIVSNMFDSLRDYYDRNIE